MNISPNKKILSLGLTLLSLAGYGILAFAAAPSGGYYPGETADPSCAQGSADCRVNVNEIERGTGAPSSTPVGSEAISYIDESNGDFYTWDGSSWNLLAGGGGSASATNGLSVIGSDIGLGGTLTQDTLIDQDGYNFEQTNSEIFSVAGFDLPTTYSHLNGSYGSFFTGTTSYMQGFAGTMDVSDLGLTDPFQAFMGLVAYENDDLLAPTLAKNDGGTLQSIILGKDGPVLRSEDLQSGDYTQLSLSETTAAITSTSNIDLISPNIRISGYQNSRDDSGSVTPVNFLYTNGSGDLLSAPVSALGGGVSTGGTNGLSTFGGGNLGLGGSLTGDTAIDTDGNLFIVTNAASFLESGMYSDLGANVNWFRVPISQTEFTAVGLGDFSGFGGDADQIILGRVDLLGGPATLLSISPTSGDMNLETVDDFNVNVGDDFNIDADLASFDLATLNVNASSSIDLSSVGAFNLSSDTSWYIGADDGSNQPGDFTSFLSMYPYSVTPGLNLELRSTETSSMGFRSYTAGTPTAEIFYEGLDSNNVSLQTSHVRATSTGIGGGYFYGANNNTSTRWDQNDTGITFTFDNSEMGAGNNPSTARIYTMNTNWEWTNNNGVFGGGLLMRLEGDTGILQVGNLGSAMATTDARLKVVGLDSVANSYAAAFQNANAGDPTYMGLAVGAGDSQGGAGGGTLIQFKDGNFTDIAGGAITFTGGTVSYGTGSDRRLKSDIVDTAFTLDDLMGIQVRDYTLNAEGGGKIHTGFIAQELVDIYPDAVFAPGGDRMWSVDYGKLTPLLVKSVQDLAIKVESIESLAASQDSTFLDSVRAWLADAANGIGTVYAGVFKSDRVETSQLCVDDVCVTADQLRAILEDGGEEPQAPTPAPAQDEQPSGESESDPSAEQPEGLELSEETVSEEPEAPSEEVSAPEEPAPAEEAPAPSAEPTA